MMPFCVNSLSNWSWNMTVVAKSSTEVMISYQCMNCGRCGKIVLVSNCYLLCIDGNMEELVNVLKCINAMYR